MIPMIKSVWRSKKASQSYQDRVIRSFWGASQFISRLCAPIQRKNKYVNCVTFSHIKQLVVYYPKWNVLRRSAPIGRSALMLFTTKNKLRTFNSSIRFGVVIIFTECAKMAKIFSWNWRGKLHNRRIAAARRKKRTHIFQFTYFRIACIFFGILWENGTFH